MKYKLFFLLSQKCGLLCRRLTFFEKPIILKVFPLFFHYILRLTKVFLKIKFSLYVGLLSPDLLPIIGPHGLLLDWILSAPPSPSTPCLPDLLHYCFKGCICSLFLVRSVAAAGTNKEQLHCRQFVVNSPPLGHWNSGSNEGRGNFSREGKGPGGAAQLGFLPPPRDKTRHFYFWPNSRVKKIPQIHPDFQPRTSKLALFTPPPLNDPKAGSFL